MRLTPIFSNIFVLSLLVVAEDQARMRKLLARPHDLTARPPRDAPTRCSAPGPGPLGPEGLVWHPGQRFLVAIVRHCSVLLEASGAQPVYMYDFRPFERVGICGGGLAYQNYNPGPGPSRAGGGCPGF